jgi:outer membrane autotransporter protein
MLDDLPADLINLTDILDAQTTEQWQGSFNQMQPANFNDIAYGQENVAERIRQIFSDHLYEQKALQCGHPYQWEFWIAPFYESVHQCGSGSKRGYEEQFGGVTVAGDYQLPENWVFTTGFSFASSDLDITHGHASSSFNSYAGSLGALWRGSALYADALFSYQYCTIEAHRRMHFSVETPLFTAEDSRKASHTQGSNQIMGHVGGGFDAIIQKRNRYMILCYPFISLDYLYVMQKSYTEHGAQSIDLHVNSKQTDLLRPEAGFGIRYRKSSDHFVCLLDTALSYVHEFRFLGKHTTSSFTASSCEFRTAGLFPQNNLVCPSVRLKMTSNKTGVSITLAYHGEYGVNFLESTGEAELRFAF